jgi:DNA-binding protein H-NS
MNHFIEIAQNKSRLRAACRDLSTKQMQTIVDSLEKIIEKRIQQEAAEAAATAAQNTKKQEILGAMKAAGLSPEDFFDNQPKVKEKKSRKPVAAKYRITDSEGSVHEWSGRGLTPKAFQKFFDNGYRKEDCLI